MAAPQPLRGVVIITLPAPDDPSQAKTITAFTVAPEYPPPPIVAPPVARPPRRAVAARSFRRAAIGMLAVVSVVAIVWVFLSSETSFEFLRTSGVDGEERGRERESFVFKVYLKGSGGRRGLREADVVAVAEVRVGGLGRRSGNVSSAAFPVAGNVFPNGMYYTIIYVGNPPRPYYLDVDTGSDLTWIQCDAPCTSCAKGPNPLYKPTAGKIIPSRDSFCSEVQKGWNIEHGEAFLQCDYEIDYADHSSSLGILVKDELHLKMMNKEIARPTFVFGCGYDQQGHLSSSPAHTDGILGLSSAKVGLPSQLASQDIIINVVGHCISQKVNAGGYMFLGDAFVPRWGMTWVPMLNTPKKYYEVVAKKISYGDKQVGPGGMGNMGTLVFDSGSSYTYFTNDAYSGILSSIKDSLEGLVQDDSDSTLPICWKADFPIRSFKEVNQIFKPVTLHFENSWLFVSRTYTIPPEGYLIINDKGNICLGILNGTEVGVANILGDISLQGRLVVYNNVMQKIGWVQSDCLKPERKTPFPFFF